MPKESKETLRIVQQPSGIESIRISKKGAPPQYIPFTPKELSMSAKKAFQTSLTMLMGHVADFHVVALTVLSKKYGHSIDEMVQTISESPECKSITLHPILRDLDTELIADNIPKELQTHPDGLYTNKTEAPYYYNSREVTSAVDSEEDIIISPKKAESKTGSPKAATKKTEIKTAKKVVKKKSAIEEAFDSMSDSDSTSNSDSDKEIIFKTKKLKISKK